VSDRRGNGESATGGDWEVGDSAMAGNEPTQNQPKSRNLSYCSRETFSSLKGNCLRDLWKPASANTLKEPQGDVVGREQAHFSRVKANTILTRYVARHSHFDRWSSEKFSQG